MTLGKRRKCGRVERAHRRDIEKLCELWGTFSGCDMKAPETARSFHDLIAAVCRRDQLDGIVLQRASNIVKALLCNVSVERRNRRAAKYGMSVRGAHLRQSYRISASWYLAGLSARIVGRMNCLPRRALRPCEAGWRQQKPTNRAQRNAC